MPEYGGGIKRPSNPVTTILARLRAIITAALRHL